MLCWPQLKGDDYSWPDGLYWSEVPDVCDLLAMACIEITPAKIERAFELYRANSGAHLRICHIARTIVETLRKEP